MTPIPLPNPSSPARSHLLTVSALRVRTLERLYRRREIVDNLIESLEAYRECQQAMGARRLVMFTAERKCS